MFGNSFFPFKKASPTATSRGGQRPQGGAGRQARQTPGPGREPRSCAPCRLHRPPCRQVSASQVCAKAFSLAGNVAREHGLLGSRPAGAIMGTGRAAHAQA